MAPSLAGKVCLVTGASRGIGKGIALQLGQAGATVYITGRTKVNRDGSVRGSLDETAKEIEARGGKCISVVCDHSKDDDVTALFQQISREQNQKLDVLVNNAYAAVMDIFSNIGKPFWDVGIDMWDKVNNVGLRNHYLCTVLAARLMVPAKSGLIVNVSSAGGLRYLFNIPYGIGKQALDRMAADCAVELRRHRVANVSIWPGAVQTEIVQDVVVGQLGKDSGLSMGDVSSTQMAKTFESGESTEYAGMCVAHLAADPNMMKKSGRVLLTAELGKEYGFTDTDGREIQSMRSISFALNHFGWRKTATMFPSWVKVPYFMLTLGGSKF